MVMIIEINVHAFTGVVTITEVETTEELYTPEQAMLTINRLLAENPNKKYSFIVYYTIKPTVV